MYVYHFILESLAILCFSICIGFLINKKYYPSREYRSMSDIDIFIDLSDREKVYKIMKYLGYENERQCDDVWQYCVLVYV